MYKDGNCIMDRLDDLYFGTGLSSYTPDDETQAKLQRIDELERGLRDILNEKAYAMFVEYCNLTNEVYSLMALEQFKKGYGLSKTTKFLDEL